MPVLISTLNGARPVSWKFGITYLCPNDCGGSDFDEGDYLPFCPDCEAELEGHEKYCSHCGAKLLFGCFPTVYTTERE